VTSSENLSRSWDSLQSPRQDFALNLSAKRRLCNTVGGASLKAPTSLRRLFRGADHGGDRLSWLEREDANLRMAESKSSYFA
jgi:hypothetical protein